MELWTWHNPAFSLTKGHVDHSRSRYYREVAGVPEAYQTLSNRLGTDQIIWCFTNRADHKDTSCEREKREWALEVPESEVLHFINGYAWARILGTKDLMEGHPSTINGRMMPSVAIPWTIVNSTYISMNRKRLTGSGRPHQVDGGVASW